MSVDHIAHLDKEILFLNSNLTLFNIFLKLNPEDKNFYAYSGLATFKFRNKDTKSIFLLPVEEKKSIES